VAPECDASFAQKTTQKRRQPALRELPPSEMRTLAVKAGLTALLTALAGLVLATLLLTGLILPALLRLAGLVLPALLRIALVLFVRHRDVLQLP
jgi:hypothetical protein